MTERLEGKPVRVTGAASDIGTALDTAREEGRVMFTWQRPRRETGEVHQSDEVHDA